jgi:hypothetical protein
LDVNLTPTVYGSARPLAALAVVGVWVAVKRLKVWAAVVKDDVLALAMATPPALLARTDAVYPVELVSAAVGVKVAERVAES